MNILLSDVALWEKPIAVYPSKILCHVSGTASSTPPLPIPVLPSASSPALEPTWLHFNIREPFPRGETPCPQLINCMEQSPWEARNSSDIQEIPPNFMEAKGLLPCSQEPATGIVPILSPINPVHAIPTDSFYTYFNITFSSTPRSSKSSLSFRFPHQNPICTSPVPKHVTCPAYLLIFELIVRMIFGKEYGSWTSSSSGFLQYPNTSSVLSPFCCGITILPRVQVFM